MALLFVPAHVVDLPQLQQVSGFLVRFQGLVANFRQRAWKK